MIIVVFIFFVFHMYVLLIYVKIFFFSLIKKVYKSCYRLSDNLVLANNIQRAVNVTEFEKQLIKQQ